MSTRLEVTRGADRDWVLQCWNEGSISNPVFLADDAISALVTAGIGQPALFEPVVSWWTSPDPITNQPTQTGYDQAQVVLSVLGVDSATLSPDAEYTLEVWRQPAGSTRGYCVWSGLLASHWASGAGLPRLPVYGSFQDMMHYAPWCRYVQDAEAYQAGFYDQRLEARLWLDDLIVRSFRSSALYPFGTPAVPSQFWSGWAGPWRSAMPSLYIRDQIWGGFVRLMPTMLASGSGYTSPPDVVAPPPPPLPAALGFVTARQRQATFRSVLDGAGGVQAVILQDPGFGYVPGATLPLTFSGGGGGSGAQATAAVAPGCLLRREQMRRICTYKAISIVGLAQMGSNAQHLAFGQYFAAKASEELTGYVAELDVNYDGLPDTPIAVYVTNTIYV